MASAGPSWYRSQRYILAYMVFGGMANVFYQRISFSITIICMVNHTAISSHSAVTSSISNISFHSNDQNNVNFHGNYTHLNYDIDTGENQLSNNFSFLPLKSMDPINSNISAMDPVTKSQTLSTHGDGHDILSPSGSISRDANPLVGDSSSRSCESKELEEKEKNEDGPLVWSKETQGLLLGAVYWTYLVFSIPADRLAQRFHKKTVVIVSMGVFSLTTILTHGASLISPWLVFIIKLIQGICTAAAVLGMYSMWARWAPPQERASLVSLSFAGSTFGSATAFPISALLCKYGFFGGWPSVYYVFGFASFVWVLLFWWLIDESPSVHRRISHAERDFIVASMEKTGGKKQAKAAWRDVLTSRPVWAIASAQFSFAWSLFLFLSTLPLYMYEVLKMDIKSNGFYSMCPYVAYLFIAVSAGRVSDFFISRKLLSVLWTRRVCCMATNLIPAVIILTISFLDCTQASLAIALLTIAVGASGFGFSNFLVNPYDIAPSHAGQIAAFGNMLACVSGIVTPYFVTAVTKDKTKAQWQIVFFTTSAVLTIGCLLFCTMASASVQSWASDKKGPTLIVISPPSELSNDAEESITCSSNGIEDDTTATVDNKADSDIAI